MGGGEERGGDGKGGEGGCGGDVERKGRRMGDKGLINKQIHFSTSPLCASQTTSPLHPFEPLKH